MVFYTATFWIYKSYRSIVFQKGYNYLCEMKTIIAYNYLFRSKIIQDDKAFMEEKTNALARSLALHKIQTFKAIMRHRMEAIV
jgi:hypothetical protein